MPQVETGASGELLVVVAAVLRQLGCAENAEGDIAGQSRRQLVKNRRCARMRAAQRQVTLFVSFSGHGVRALLRAAGNFRTTRPGCRADCYQRRII
jgi:hypothetical protein